MHHKKNPWAMSGWLLLMCGVEGACGSDAACVGCDVAGQRQVLWWWAGNWTCLSVLCIDTRVECCVLPAISASRLRVASGWLQVATRATISTGGLLYVVYTKGIQRVASVCNTAYQLCMHAGMHACVRHVLYVAAAAAMPSW